MTTMKLYMANIYFKGMGKKKREKREKQKCRRRQIMPSSTTCIALKGRGNNKISNIM